MKPGTASPARNNAPRVHQTAQAVLRRDLRAGLVEAATLAGPGGFGSVLFRAAAAAYALLAEHAPDRRGRCWRCRRHGSRVGPARRSCRVYPIVLEWLQRPRTLLAASLRRDLGLPVPPPRQALPSRARG